MAGRILVIEFDDTAQADALRARIDQATRKGRRYRVIGMFSRPNAPFCTCGSQQITQRGQREVETKWSRKYGFRICTQCNRYTSTLGGLKNLIPIEDIIDPPEAEFLHMGKTWTGIFYPVIFSMLPRRR